MAYVNHNSGSPRKIKDNSKGTVRRFSAELEFLRSSAVKELRRRGYSYVAIEKPVERCDGSLIYVKVYAKGEGGLPDVAVECFREASRRVSRRAMELRSVLPNCIIVLVFPECLATKAAKYSSDGDEVWLVDSDGNVACYGKGDVEGLRTHLRNKISKHVQEVREEVGRLLEEYEATRELLKVYSRNIVYTQRPLRDLFAVAAKLVLGDKLYPELADVPFLGPYHDRVIAHVKRLRELRGKISEKIVEVADEILKIETAYRIGRRGESRGEPLYQIEEAGEEIALNRPLVPPLKYLAETYMAEGLEDVERCIEIRGRRKPIEGIHGYIMDEVIAELREEAGKTKSPETGENMSNARDEHVTIPRKVLEEMLEEVREMRRILESGQEAL